RQPMRAQPIDERDLAGDVLVALALVEAQEPDAARGAHAEVGVDGTERGQRLDRPEREIVRVPERACLDLAERRAQRHYFLGFKIPPKAPTSDQPITVRPTSPTRLLQFAHSGLPTLPSPARARPLQ